MKVYPAEKELGPVEYKLKIKRSDEKIEKLATQLKYRLGEGGGEAFLVLGVTDDGRPLGLSEEELEESLKVLDEATKRISAVWKIVQVAQGKRGKVVEVFIRRCRKDSPPIFLNIPVLGNVDSGKSTLISVLCTGELDDGDGLAMSKIARYLHEIKSGRTSSITPNYLGYDIEGNIVNHKLLDPLEESEIFLKSSKIIILIDLGGHERYLRTTLKGVMGRAPDYAMLVVAANAGLIGMGREHLGLLVALKIPFFTVITKKDLVPPEILNKTLAELYSILKMPGVRKIPLLVENESDVVLAARLIPKSRVVPIFIVSNVTGEGLHHVEKFLNLLPPRMRWKEKRKRSFLMYVEHTFNVKGVGLVVSGLILEGEVKVDEKVLIGPDEHGKFHLVKVKSIHVNRVNVEEAHAGEEACLALQGIDPCFVKKGMCLLSQSSNPSPVRSFEAEVKILHHPTMIKRGYQAVCHIHTIRHAVVFEQLSKEPLRTGDTAYVKLRFLYHPWYIRKGDVFVFRESRTRGLGIVTKT
ncbi:MAG: hypothetical protein DRN04_02510 [Thermoprotei archaeon]|mgnify:FL=1|nr:MAG: hypothetical protein DRN04_02510 [Thermoprotei archaeon]